MKFYLNYTAMGIKKIVPLLVTAFLLYQSPLHAQVITVTGAYISSGTGTIIIMDTLQTDNTSTLANAGTLNLATINNAGTLQGNGVYNISKDFTSTGSFSANNSTVNFNGNNNQKIPGLTFYNVTVSGTGSIKTASGNLVVNGALNINSTNTVDLATYSLSGSLTSIAGSGILKTQSTASIPIPSGKTWTGPVYYNSSSAQNIVRGNYNDLDGTGGNRIFEAATIGIAGAFTPGSGTYTTTGTNIDFNGTSAQTIPAFTFNSLTASGGSTKTLGGNISLLDSLSLGANTTLELSSSDVTLKSTATAVARIAYTPSTAAITYGTGRFIVERYVPGRRKYRLFASSVTSSTNSTLTTGEEAISIWGNWQNSGNNITANTGTIITGGSAADGYDQQTTTASIFTYDDVNKKYIGFTTANGKNTKYTPLKAGIAYYLFVYGDRTNTITTSNPKNTTISSKGKIVTGDQTYTTGSPIPLTGVTDRFTMLGNPFASPVNWATVSKTNVSSTFWGWDPNLNSTGGYVTVSTTGTTTLISPFSGTVGLNQYIQPGQGFFVKTTGASPSMTIHESDKVSNFNSIAFFAQPANNNLVNNIPLIAVNLLYPSGPNNLLADGAISAFDNSFSNSVGLEDGTKVAGSTETLAIQNGSDLLSIDARKMPQNLDTMFINLGRITKAQYTLQIFANKMTGIALSPFLEDAYLNTTQPLSLTDTNSIVFNVTAGVPASSAANRFRIVYHDITILPVTFRMVKASPKNKDILVEWSVAEESSTVKYQVEHSTNGTNFTIAATVNARGIAGTQDYQWLHIQPAAGNHFYRIKAVNADGRYVVSNVVLVKTGIDPTAEPAISVFPNPVKNQQVNILMSNMEKGQYPVQMVNANGQVVYTQNIYHNGGTYSQIITFSRKVTTGVYYLIISSGNKKYTQKLFFE